jgi:STE24 endopeptidase
MTITTILIVYCSVFLLDLVVDTMLSIVNLGHTARQTGNVPPPLQAHTTVENHDRAISYTLVRGRFGLVESIVSSAIVFVLLVGGVLGGIERLAAAAVPWTYVRGIVFILIVSLIFRVAGLPFSLYGQFRIEARFGFNRMTVPMYFADLAKGLLVSLVISVPLLFGLFWLIDALGAIWWIVAFAAFVLVDLALTIVFPLLIAPLFNKFTPLPEGSLREKIGALADRLGFRTNGIFVMDGSKRSKHSNAYFTGLGKAKRIVLFDTLVETLSEDEILGVLAHEIGHEKKRHVLRSLGLGLAMAFAGFWLLGMFLDFRPIYAAFGFDGPSSHAALVLLAFCSGPFTFFITPLFSALSRVHEYEADRYSVDACGGSAPLAQALIRLSKENLSNPSPHPLYSFFYYSHPVLTERIRAMEAYEQRKSVHGSLMKNGK